MGWGHPSRGWVPPDPPSPTSARDPPLFSDLPLFSDPQLPNGGAITVIVALGSSMRGFSPPPRGNYRQFAAIKDVFLNRGGERGVGDPLTPAVRAYGEQGTFFSCRFPSEERLPFPLSEAGMWL